VTLPEANNPPPPTRPNHLRFNHDSTHFSEDFGNFHSVTAVNLPGVGHRAHIEIRALFGFRINVTPEFLIALLRDAPGELAKLRYLRDVHDAVGGVE
jgi:hypothetical protein